MYRRPRSTLHFLFRWCASIALVFYIITLTHCTRSRVLPEDEMDSSSWISPLSLSVPLSKVVVTLHSLMNWMLAAWSSLPTSLQLKQNNNLSELTFPVTPRDIYPWYIQDLMRTDKNILGLIFQFQVLIFFYFFLKFWIFLACPHRVKYIAPEKNEKQNIVIKYSFLLIF